MARIIEVMEEKNPWWKDSFNLEFKEREIYCQIQKFLPLPQMLAFTGLRRVGKTTLMLKIVEDQIKKGFSPRNILFFSFDEFKEIDIRDIIKEYEHLMEKNFGNEKFLFLLDEIQKLKGWENQLKGIYDSFGKNVKIIISGSESLFVKKKSKETLAGRLFEFKIDQLTFREFLKFKEAEFKPFNLYKKELIRLFNEFILTQGFPELVGTKDKEIIKKYLKESILEKVIYRDLPGLYEIKDISVIEALLNIITGEPGQQIDLLDLSSELKISRQSVANYLAYLEDAFLIKKLYNYSKNRRKVERKLKKYYPAIISTNLLFMEDSLSRSKVFEGVIINQLKTEFFWRDPYKNEVDAVVISKERVLPIEIKYGKINLGGLRTFMRQFKVEEGYILSYDQESQQKIDGKIITVIPAFKFLAEKESND